MESLSTLVPVLCSLSLLLGFGAFAAQSLREGERRAAVISLGMAALGLIPLLLVWALPRPVRSWLTLTLGLLCALGGIAFLLPVGRVDVGGRTPSTQVDERDIVFARARLKPGSPEYTAYYTRHPERKAIDDQTRSLPGLLSPQAKLAHPLHFAAAEACFILPAALRDWVNGAVAEEPMRVEPAAMTSYLKGLARYLGARTVGVTELRSYHVYSHIGRGSGVYGAPIVLDHRYAIAFTVEMDFAMMGPAPEAPEVLETAKQYSEAAQIAVQLAAFIRQLGYEARAHIDGNYRVIAPLVARDAGLGEIGRMGLLITPQFGPRVRLGVVTTNLPLRVDSGEGDPSVLDFCTICRKCAENCPSRAIPLGERQLIDGALRWRIDAERCFRYWNVIGTDCGRCVSVCPYSHPDSLMHNLVRWEVRHSGVARRVVLRMDDLFYGRHPAQRKAPAWLAVDTEPPGEGDGA